MTVNQQCELADLKANLKQGTCCGLPASKEQQAVRRRRIRELQAR